MDLGAFPRSGAESHHLPPELVATCTAGRQHPLNPHRQKLLAASARKPAKVEKKPDEPEHSAKAKGKAKAKAAKAKIDLKVHQDNPATSAREAAKVAYNDAKRKFMEKFLNGM